MRELNKLIYETIKDDLTYKIETGSDSQDPRLYKSKTPIKVSVTGSKKAYGVYYKSGSIHNSNNIHGASKNDFVYVVEIYGKKDTVVELLAYRIEKLFEENNFNTDTFIIGYTYATRGQLTFDEDRQLYVEPVQIYLRNILTLNEAS